MESYIQASRHMKPVPISRCETYVTSSLPGLKSRSGTAGERYLEQRVHVSNYIWIHLLWKVMDATCCMDNA